MAAAHAPQQGQWTTGLCGCFEDPSSCCCSCCCPCIPVGQVVNVLDSGNTSCFQGGLIFCVLPAFGWLYTCGYRKKLRMRFGLPADPCNDVLTDCCCLCCSISQTHRELKNRNMDPSKGYIATPPIAPLVSQFMHKG